MSYIGVAAADYRAWISNGTWDTRLASIVFGSTNLSAMPGILSPEGQDLSPTAVANIALFALAIKGPGRVLRLSATSIVDVHEVECTYELYINDAATGQSVTVAAGIRGAVASVDHAIAAGWHRLACHVSGPAVGNAVRRYRFTVGYLETL